MKLAHQLLVVLVSSTISLFAQASTTYDIAADFSVQNNPNNVWSYGYSNTLGGNFIQHAESGSVSGVEFWRTNIAYGDPAIVHNPGINTVSLGTPVIGPGELISHPGPQGQFSVIRFTAQLAGSYLLNALFFGADTVGTSTDVHILLNGNSLFDSWVNGYRAGSETLFGTTFSLGLGDVVDFAVGVGSNGNLFYDSTGIAATLTLSNAQPIPEPGILWLCLVPLAILATRARDNTLTRLSSIAA